MPRISIFTPTYNAEKFLASTIESVLKQTFKDWELIIMDGASKDRTLEIARGFAKNDPRIKIFSEKDEGAWHALCKCAEVATGDFICFMPASDGYVNDRWFEEAMKTADENPDVSLLWGIPFEIEEDGTPRGPHFIYAHFLSAKHGGGKKAIVGELWRRLLGLLRPSQFLRTLRNFEFNRLRTVGHALTATRIPQKEEWFFHWLKTGHFFPDANMLVKRKVYLSCAPKYILGSRVQGGCIEMFYNFNSRGYLSYGLAIPANYGRKHGGQLNVVLQKKNDEFTEKYMKQINELRERLTSQKEMAFIDSQGKLVKTVSLQNQVS